jgi:hypothetical protein
LKVALLKSLVSAAFLLTAALVSTPVKAQKAQLTYSDAPCAFDESALSYAGTPQEQALCLLRPVLRGGHLGAQLKTLPAPLDKLIGKTLEVSHAALKLYLTEEKISEADIGGLLSNHVSRANPFDPNAAFARYFVIHDVSTPNYLDADFPSDINEASWMWNDLRRKWLNLKVAHVYINRTGESVTAVDFKTQLPDPYHGTKFARDHLKNKGKGLYLHVELVQPRRRDTQGAPGNDRIAPEPGFTDAQLKRLALVYIAASVRSGEWLIPAFHAAIDAGIPDAHDDPQNFDTARWATNLSALLKSIKKMKVDK